MQVLVKSKDSKGSGAIILIAIVITAIAYLLSILLRFGISRKREYLADAGAADMTKKPHALANALRKISEDPYIEAVESRDVAQLFIGNPKPSSHKASWDNMFTLRIRRLRRGLHFLTNSPNCFCHKS